MTMQMSLRPLAELDVRVGPPVTTGPTSAGESRFIPITGGTVEGADLRGEVLPGGADWQEVLGGGILEIRARYLLRTELGEIIEVRSEGLRHATPEVADRLVRGEPVGVDEYYFRTSVRLRTGSERLVRLNRLLAVAHGERLAGRVHLTLAEVT